MLTYSIENKGEKSLYEFFYESIRNDIVSGELPPDGKLPSKRAFARHHGVSIITVENTYGQLLAEGYIYSRPRSGYYAANIQERALPGRGKEPLAIRPDCGPSVIFDLSARALSVESFPFATWTRLMRRVSTDERHGLMNPSPANGLFQLREAIASHLRDFRGMDVSPECIIVGAGTEYLYGLLISLLGRDKLYAMETPGYSKSELVFTSMDAEVVRVPLDDAGVDVQALRASHADVLHISPAHQFPTGIVTPVSRRYELLGWASEKQGRYILEDDYDSELRLSGKPIPALYSIDRSECVVYMNTFTRSLSPTIRIAYMVLPGSLMREYTRRLGFYSCTVSNFEQYALAAFIREGYFEKHINRMRVLYRTVRDQITREVAELLPAGSFRIIGQDSGPHFLLHAGDSMPEAELRARLLAAGVRVSFLSDYHAWDEQAPHEGNVLVVNYSGVAPGQCADLARALASVLHSNG